MLLQILDTWSLRLHVESNKTPRFLGGSLLGVMRESPIFMPMLVLTGVAMSGDHDQFCFVIIQFQKVVGHPYLYVLDKGFKTRYCCLL